MRDASGNLLGSTSYRRVPLGSMGYNTGITTASDESWQLVKTDGAGAWRRDGLTGSWAQCFRRNNTTASLFTADSDFGESDGAWEAEIARGNPAVAYSSFRHRILKSTDRGLNWTLCAAIPEMRMDSNAQSGSPANPQRLTFCKMAVDPTDPNVVYWGPQGQGLLRTVDGMATYSKLTAVPDAVSPYGRAQAQDAYMLIAIDETSALVNGRHSVVVVVSIGNGVYRSTDGGETFTQISSTLLYPANIQFIDGVLWLFDEITTGNALVSGPNIYTYNGTAWSAAFGPPAPYTVKFVAKDPVVPSTWIGGRFLFRSTDSGMTWVNLASGNGSNVEAVPHVAPMIATQFNASKALINSRLSAASNGRIYVSTGYGIMYIESANLRGAGAGVEPKLTLHEDTAGIENIVPQQTLITSNGSAFMVSQDKAVIKMAPTGEYPKKSYPASTLTNGYDIDYAAQDPNYLAAQITKNSIYAGYSTDNGESWQQFPTTGTTKTGGGICVVDVGKVVIFPGANGWPVVTHDGGQTWADCVFSGFAKITSGTTGWGFGQTETDRFIVCNDKDNPLNVYAYNYGVSGVTPSEGIWKSIDGGLNFTKVSTQEVLPSLTGYHNKLTYRSGFLWLNQYWQYPINTLNAGIYLWRSADDGATFQQVPALDDIFTYTFGKGRFGSTYPALYGLGWIGGVNGLWRCENANAANIADMTWTQLEETQEFSRPVAMAGDPTKFGRLIVGRGGMSYEEVFYDYTFRAVAG